MRLLDSEPLWTVDDLAFNWRDDYGVEWHVELAEGWRSGPPVRTALEDKPQDDGAFDVESFRGSRVVTLQGWAKAPDVSAAEDAVDRFTAMFADGKSLKPLTVAESNRTRMAMVRLSDAPRAELRPGRVLFPWQVVLVAPDPRKYAADLTVLTTSLPLSSGSGGFTAPFTAPFTSAAPAGSTGVIIAGNGGTVPTWPRITIAGPVTDPVVENATTGRRLRIDYTLASGDTLDVDFENRVVLLNGTTPVDALASGSSFWPLAKGPNEIRYTAFAGSSGPPMTVSYRSAWI